MSYIGIPPFGQTVRSVTTATATSGQTTFNISGGYVVGYVDVYLNGLLLAPTAYTATNGTTVVLGTGATVGDKFQALSYQPVSLVDALKASNNLSEVASASTARTNLGLGSIATQSSSNVSITGGSITGITDLGVADGGTGASTLTGYVKGSGTSPLTASSTIPNTDITGLGTISTQDANNVSISGGSITGITDLAVADGGTGASSLTANNVILGNGTSPVQFVAPGTAGNVLTSNGTTWLSQAAGGGTQDFDLVVNYTFSGTSVSQFDVTNLPTTTGWYAMVGRVFMSNDAQPVSMAFRCSIDNGSTFYSGASNYWRNASGSNGPNLFADLNKSGANPGIIAFNYYYYQPGGFNNADCFTLEGIATAFYINPTGGFGSTFLALSAGLVVSNSPTNAIRFFRTTGTGTYTDGYVKIYKLAMS